MGIDIFASSDPTLPEEDLSKIEIDKEFARRFEHNKKREDLQKYEELKKKGVIDSSSDEEDSEDDDDEELIEPEKDLKFYDALVSVKKGKPIVFEEESESDDDEEMEGKNEKNKKEKPVYLKDVNYKNLMESGPEFGEESLACNPKVYDRSQQENVKAFLDAEKEAFGEDDEDEDLIKEKEKGKGNDDEMEIDRNAEVIHKKLDEFFGKDENLDKDELFLKSYLLGKKWVDKKKDDMALLDDIDVSEDEDELEKQEEYEAKYNFRFEEAESDRILGHARNVESVRNIVSKRKVQRKNKEERMVQAKLERDAELKRLKNLKKEEIEEKVEKFKEIAGLGDAKECKLDVKDFEGDFDPEEYDKKMRETFDDDYYGTEDPEPGFGSDEEGDLEKPDFEKEDELLGLPKDWDICESKSGFKALREKFTKKEEEEEEEYEEVEKKEGKRKRKRKGKKEKQEEEDGEVAELRNELLEELYKLDYEDVIGGDVKTRFKYKPVEKKTYDLDIADILCADEKNLNQYVSIKKLAPYREKEWEVTYHQKLKKESILYGEGTLNESKSSKKHKVKENIKVEREEDKTEVNEELNGDADVSSRKIKRKQRKAELKISQARLEAYGMNQSKPQKKKQT